MNGPFGPTGSNHISLLCSQHKSAGREHRRQDPTESRTAGVMTRVADPVQYCGDRPWESRCSNHLKFQKRYLGASGRPGLCSRFVTNPNHEVMLSLNTMEYLLLTPYRVLWRQWMTKSSRIIRNLVDQSAMMNRAGVEGADPECKYVVVVRSSNTHNTTCFIPSLCRSSALYAHIGCCIH